MANRVRSMDTTSELINGGGSTQCNGTFTANNTGMGVYQGYTKTTEDVVTPKFHLRSKRGEVINNFFSSTKVEHKVESMGSWSIARIAACTGTNFKSSLGTNYRQRLTVGKLLPMTGSEFNGLENLATLAATRAWAAVQEPSVQGLVEMAELSKTMRMLFRTSRHVKQLLDKAKGRKSKDSRSKQSLGSFISENWLAYRYGWTPLLRTIDDAYKAIAVPSYSQRQTARGSSEGPKTTVSDTLVESDSFYTPSLARTNTAQRSCRSGVLYTHRFSTSDRFGLSLQELPSAIWELFPYSFVADWFLNIGDYIRAMTPKVGVRVLSSWTTIQDVVDQKGVLTMTPSQTGQYTYGGTCGGTYLVRTTKTVRNPLAVPGVANLLPEINFEKKKDWLHTADAFALLAQRLRAR